ncbi:MAG TPA: Fur family transcriptional regulator [Thermoanaerobaculia bacterium]|nr:Fur family transcriptional regulator [Thermoanaerobaculia bacterium]
MPKRREQRLVQRIRAAGFRATRPRLLILSFLARSAYPVGIKEIIRGVGASNVDQVTVYRILGAFKNAGLVVQVDFQHGRAYYELKDSKRDHHHIICTGCDRLEDFTGCDFEALAGQALRQTKRFATVSNHSLELFGLCNACAKKSP